MQSKKVNRNSTSTRPLFTRRRSQRGPGRPSAILCPIDFSKHSAHALRHALETARRFDGRLTVLFVNDPLLLTAAARFAGGQSRFVEHTRAALERFVTRSQAGQSSPAPAIDFAVTIGDPAEEILHASKRLQSDLIVIGTRGVGGLQKLFFGSTTERVLRDASVPVLAIPPVKRAPLRSTRLLPIERVVAPLDLVGEWQSDVSRAAGVAATFDAELVLVHVLKPVVSPGWMRLDVAPTNRQRVERARLAIERLAAKMRSSVARITTDVREGDPPEVIARLAAAPSSIVVMSLRGTAGIWGARRGSVAYQVLTRSGTPVLALPRRRLGGRFSARLQHAWTGALSKRDRLEMAGIDALLSQPPARGRDHASGPR